MRSHTTLCVWVWVGGPVGVVCVCRSEGGCSVYVCVYLSVVCGCFRKVLLCVCVCMCIWVLYVGVLRRSCCVCVYVYLSAVCGCLEKVCVRYLFCYLSWLLLVGSTLGTGQLQVLESGVTCYCRLCLTTCEARALQSHLLLFCRLDKSAKLR